MDISIDERLQIETDECNQHGLIAEWHGDWELVVTFRRGRAWYRINVSIPDHYPDTPPDIFLQEPFQYYTPTLYPRIHWSRRCTLYEWIQFYIDTTLHTMLKMRSSMSREMFPSILLAKSTNPVYLVLGAFPSEEPKGRAHYSNPNVFLLDKVDDTGPRFLKADFASPLELGSLASLLPGAFDEICFDWSTLKFFNVDDTEDSLTWQRPYLRPEVYENIVNHGQFTMLLERLVYLRMMLKDGGTIYFERFRDGPGGQHALERDVYYDKHWFLTYCERAGFDCSSRTADTIHDSVLTPMLFHDRPSHPILVGRKIG